MGGPEIVLKGATSHTAKVGTTALGTIRSVEYAIQNLDEVAAGIAQRITETRKRILDLDAQAGQPFEYEKRLADLYGRQQEIAELLDLTKNQAPSRLDSDEASEPSEAKTDDD
jgi:hypothetical protein